MNWFTNTLSSTLGRKWLMALTGLFLSIFLIVHLIGNLQLLYGDGGLSFNTYAKFMTTNPVIKLTSYMLYAGFLLHILDAYALMMKNRKARPVGYHKVNNTGTSSWSSRNMGILGTILLIFLVVHMRQFWFEMHWGQIANDANGNRDLYSVCVAAFSQWWYVALYVVGMGALAYHLLHGFQSAFQSMGMNNKYTKCVKNFGKWYSILIPLLFIFIALFHHFNH